MNKKVIEIIKAFEGFREEAYLCPGGRWTIGFGTTREVKPGMRVTREKAESFLKRDLEQIRKEMSRMISVELIKNEWVALLSLVYNIGLTAFRKSTLLKKLNQGDKAGAAEEFLNWNRAGRRIVVGLTRRRRDERDIFLKGV